MRTLLVILCCLSYVWPVTAQYHIRIAPVDSNIFVYTSYGDVGEYKNIDANAVVVVSGNDAVLFDTPWDSVQAAELILFVRDSLKKNILLSVITHAHADRIGSIDAMHMNNIPTVGYQLIVNEAKRHGHTAPEYLFYNTDTTIRCGNIDIVACYPGAGHTVDNIVLYIPSKKFLYGGCFIKSGHSQSIGNIEDANIAEWPVSVQKMQERFATTGIDMVIPGHGSWKSDQAIENTLHLLTEERKGNY